MRTDFQIAILLALAAIPAGVALMAAPEYVRAVKEYPAPFFWAGVILAVALIGAAAFIALRGEAAASEFGDTRRMIALTGMIIFLLGFVGSAAVYFWPNQRPARSGASEPTQTENRASPQPEDTPHIRAELIINSTTGDDAVFSLNLTNIGNRLVSGLRIGMKSAQVFDYEPHADVPRQIPPGGTISARGIMANGLAKSRELSVFLTYRAASAVFSSSYKFDFKGLPLRGNDSLNPIEWQESEGDILLNESKGLVETTFAGPVGSMFFSFPEIRPDTHSNNNITLFTNGKKLVIDIENRLASFRVIAPSGKEWEAELRINPQPNHKLAVSWDEGGIALSLDGAQATAGRDARSPLPIPTIGSLQYVIAGLEVERKISTKDTAAQIAVTLRNTNPFLVKYRGTIVGNVNGITSPRGEITFDGYVNANSEVIIRYDRLVGIQVPQQADMASPTLLGTAKYRITYWAAANDAITRTSGKTLRIEMWPPPFTDKPGQHMERAKVLFDEEIEE